MFKISAMFKLIYIFTFLLSRMAAQLALVAATPVSITRPTTKFQLVSVSPAATSYRVTMQTLRHSVRLVSCLLPPDESRQVNLLFTLTSLKNKRFFSCPDPWNPAASLFNSYSVSLPRWPDVDHVSPSTAEEYTSILPTCLHRLERDNLTNIISC
jgi:hypothetical protein